MLTEDDEKRTRRLKNQSEKKMPQDDPVTRVSKYQSKLVYDAEAEIALMSKHSLENFVVLYYHLQMCFFHFAITGQKD